LFLSQLAWLDLSANFIANDGARAIAEALMTNNSLQYLDMHSCGIHDKGHRDYAIILEVSLLVNTVTWTFSKVWAQ